MLVSMHSVSKRALVRADRAQSEASRALSRAGAAESRFEVDGLGLPHLLIPHNPVDRQNSTTNRGANVWPVTLTAEMRSAR